MSNTLFPVFLKTEKARFLIVGGGHVGLEKTQTLLKQNPEVAITIVATSILPELWEVIYKFKNITTFQRHFEEEDVNSVDFVIAATNDKVLNASIKKIANKRNILVNAADQPELCDFYLGSIVNKGSLKIAISTNGKSPVLARRMREHLEEAIPENINDSIDNLNAFRNSHKGNFQEKVADLNRITQNLSATAKPKKVRNYQRLVLEISILFIVFFVGYGISTVLSFSEFTGYVQSVPTAFYTMLLVGFIAQLVDGALGLGYGITCAVSMMLFGVNLPAISGSIHTAEMFSSGVSGYSHYKFGNVNKRLFLWIVIPGVVGAFLGATVLIYLGNSYEAITYGLLSVYTMFIGIRLIVIALKKPKVKKKVNNAGFLGFAGGFLDAFSGGGWGPIVTSSLLAKGRKSSYVVGTVSLAEFFVTLTAAITFFASLGVSHWYIIVGLVLGGTIAAPFAARLAGRLPQKAALLAVATLVIVFSIRIFFKVI